MSKPIIWLGAVAGLLILQELAGKSLQDLFVHDVIVNQQLLNRSSKQLRLKERSLRQMEVAIAKFSERSKLSLCGDPAKASIEYQEYLVRLTETCALSPVMINSSQPEKLEELGHVLHFSLQASGTTEQFGKLLDGFHQTDALHRLSHVNIFQSFGPDSPTHSITLDIALLVLDAASDEPLLRTIQSPLATSMSDVFEGVDIFRRPVSNAASSGSLTSMLSGLLQNLPTPAVDMQGPPAMEVPAPQPTEPAITKPDPRSYMRLVGIIQRDDKRYAVFVNHLENQQHAYGEASDLEGIGITARVTRISPTDVWIILDEEELRLPIGSLLNEAVRE